MKNGKFKIDNWEKYFLFMISILIFSQTKLYSQTADTLSFSKQSIVAESKQTKSSTKAVLLSLALPGLGQIYNESYWKTPAILGFVGYFGYVWKQENDLYHKYQTEYRNNPSDARAKRVRDFYHNERDRFSWYLGVTYLLSAVDAYVDAQLFDFDVNTNLGKEQKITLRFYFAR